MQDALKGRRLPLVHGKIESRVAAVYVVAPAVAPIPDQSGDHVLALLQVGGKVDPVPIGAAGHGATIQPALKNNRLPVNIEIILGIGGDCGHGRAVVNIQARPESGPLVGLPAMGHPKPGRPGLNLIEKHLSSFPEYRFA